jgi:hypothetical protein
VQRRLIEAYSVERRLPQAQRRLLIASAWPSMAVEFSDIVGRADDDRKDRFHSWEFTRLGVSAADISRMEQAHDWLRILKPYPEERLCLAQWAAAVAYRDPCENAGTRLVTDHVLSVCGWVPTSLRWNSTGKGSRWGSDRGGRKILIFQKHWSQIRHSS